MESGVCVVVKEGVKVEVRSLALIIKCGIDSGHVDLDNMNLWESAKACMGKGLEFTGRLPGYFNALRLLETIYGDLDYTNENKYFRKTLKSIRLHRRMDWDGEWGKLKALKEAFDAYDKERGVI